MESSNTLEPVETTGAEAASAAEQSTPEVNENHENLQPIPEDKVEKPEVPKPEATLKEKVEALKKPEAAAPAEKTAAPGTPASPAYTPNFKYKAFGKEKELDPFWQPLVKDAESEKKVKELFTRADAFDDMKGRYETTSIEHQKVLQQFTALDRDVKRVTKFLNSGDYDNFFSSLRISDDMLLQHLQRKAEIAKLSPLQQQAYQQGVQARAENLMQQESMEDLQNNYTQQRVLARTMQLDGVLMRPEVSNAASAWDSKMGLGSFRQLVIQEGANHYLTTKQDLPAENVVDLVLKKFGKLIEGTQSPQAVQAPGTPAAPQAPGAPVVVQGKPVIPNVNGRGTSPVKQAPKSLDDLRKLGKQLRAQEANDVVANV